MSLPEPANDLVPPDRVRGLSSWNYARLTFSIYWRRFRKKLPRHFRCDCGARYVWSLHEHQHWDQIQTITCYECGDIYLTLQNTIVRIIPNPLHRSMISDHGIADGHPFSALARRLFPSGGRADV